MSAPINIKGGKEFKEKVLESKLPVLVDFWASWCGPCQMMAPILDDIAREYEGKLVVAKVLTEDDENMPLAYLYQIQSIPNMKLFVDGQVKQDFIGFRPEQVFSQELRPFIKD